MADEFQQRIDAFRKAWQEAFEEVKAQNSYYIEVPNTEAYTVERVTPAAVEGQCVEQQAEE